MEDTRTGGYGQLFPLGGYDAEGYDCEGSMGRRLRGSGDSVSRVRSKKTVTIVISTHTLIKVASYNPTYFVSPLIVQVLRELRRLGPQVLRVAMQH